MKLSHNIFYLLFFALLASHSFCTGMDEQTVRATFRLTLEKNNPKQWKLPSENENLISTCISIHAHEIKSIQTALQKEMFEQEKLSCCRFILAGLPESNAISICTELRINKKGSVTAGQTRHILFSMYEHNLPQPLSHYSEASEEDKKNLIVHIISSFFNNLPKQEIKRLEFINIESYDRGPDVQEWKDQLANIVKRDQDEKAQQFRTALENSTIQESSTKNSFDISFDLNGDKHTFYVDGEIIGTDVFQVNLYVKEHLIKLIPTQCKSHWKQNKDSYKTALSSSDSIDIITLYIKPIKDSKEQEMIALAWFGGYSAQTGIAYVSYKSHYSDKPMNVEKVREAYVSFVNALIDNRILIKPQEEKEISSEQMISLLEDAASSAEKAHTACTKGINKPTPPPPSPPLPLPKPQPQKTSSFLRSPYLWGAVGIAAITGAALWYAQFEQKNAPTKEWDHRENV